MVESIQDWHRVGLGADNPGRKIFLLDIPHIFWSETCSYLFPIAHNSLMPDLRYRLGDDAERIELIASVKGMEMRIVDELVACRVKGQKNMKSKGELKEILDDGHIVLQFSPAARSLFRYTGDSGPGGIE